MLLADQFVGAVTGHVNERFVGMGDHTGRIGARDDQLAVGKRFFALGDQHASLEAVEIGELVFLIRQTAHVIGHHVSHGRPLQQLGDAFGCPFGIEEDQSQFGARTGDDG